MSLDITLYGESREVPCHCRCGHSHSVTEREQYFECNITHNLTEMADQVGLYKPVWRPEECGISKAKDMIPFLRDGLEELQRDPERYKAFNPSNGWGSYENLINNFRKYLAACEEFPESTVDVSR